MPDCRSLTYTTADELIFLRALAARGKWTELANLSTAYRLRSWSGEGMSVDPARVFHEIKRLLVDARPAVDHFAPLSPSSEDRRFLEWRRALEAELYQSNAILLSEDATI